MANPEKTPSPGEGQVRWDSLNCEIVEVHASEMQGDNMVRPMRESLRKRLRPPYNGQPLPPLEPPKDYPHA
jgi:hypothetical protein